VGSFYFSSFGNKLQWFWWRFEEERAVAGGRRYLAAAAGLMMLDGRTVCCCRRRRASCVFSGFFCHCKLYDEILSCLCFDFFVCFFFFVDRGFGEKTKRFCFEGFVFGLMTVFSSFFLRDIYLRLVLSTA